MNKQIEALKLALEALEDARTFTGAWPAGAKAITAIREALAEGCQCPACKIAPHESDCPVHNEPAWPNGPCDCGAQQQEPVAWTDLLKKADEIVRGKIVWKRFIDGTPLANDIAVWMADFAQQHTSPQPPQRKPLTDEEIWDEVKAADLDWQTGWSLDEDASNRYITFARAIEAAHGIKGDV